MSTGIYITPSSTLNLSSTPINGTNTRVIFQENGFVQQDANFTYNSTQKRLTLKAVGTAATDIPLVVRNSADTNDLINVAGDTITLRATSAPMMFNQGSVAGVGQGFNFTNTSSTIKLLCGNSGDGTINSTIGQLVLQSRGTANQLVLINNLGNNSVNLGHSSAGSGTNKITLINGIAPTTNLTDIFQLYSADRGGVAGKASAHFRAEDGTINVIGDLSGFGTSTPGARLDVRAQGALSTDIAFRVRNSTDTSNLIESRGNGHLIVSNSNFADVFTAQNSLESFRVGGGNLNYVRTTQSGNLTFVIRNGASSNALITLNAGAGNSVFWENLFGFDTTTKNLTVFGGSAIAGGNSGDSVMWVRSGTSTPSASFADMFGIYSADITAGNAAPHFRTENGAIVKLYQETTGVTESTLVSGGGTTLTDTDTFDGYTLKQIVKALKNQGLLQ